MKRWISMALTLLMIVPLTVTTSAADGKTDITGRPSGITITNDGKLLVTDVWDMAVWEMSGTAAKKLTKAGTRDLLGKVIGGKEDGSVASASFSAPFAIAPYRDGYVVSDTDNHLIRFISGDRTKVSTIAGSGYAGLKDDKGLAASFNRPTGLANDLDGNLYIADTDNHVIRKMDADGNVTTFAGSVEGYAVGSLSNTSFQTPTGLCWYDGKLYVADSGNHRIVVIENEKSEVLAGGVRNRSDEDELNGGSYRNGNLKMAGFASPQGVLANAQGIYVADTGNGAVRKIADGLVTTLDSTDILSPRGLALVGGKLYVCDTNSTFVFAIAGDHPSPTYADVDADAPWHDAATDMYRYGIFKGVSSNAFAPDGVMTRAQYITALSQMHTMLFPDVIIAGECEPFADVPADTYYTDAVYWGRANGATEGTGMNQFSPDAKLTRETVATFLYKYAKMTGYDVSGDNAEWKAFSDHAQTSNWATAPMVWAVGTGIFDAEPDGKLNPRGLATRCWTAQVFMHFISLEGTIK